MNNIEELLDYVTTAASEFSNDYNIREFEMTVKIVATNGWIATKEIQV